MPDPRKGESRANYLSRYMGSEEAKATFPDRKQRIAVAYSKFKQARKKRK